MEESKNKLYEVIKHFPQVLGCGVSENKIVVYFVEKIPSFIEEFEGFKIETIVIEEFESL